MEGTVWLWKEPCSWKSKALEGKVWLRKEQLGFGRNCKTLEGTVERLRPGREMVLSFQEEKREKAKKSRSVGSEKRKKNYVSHRLGSEKR